MPVAAGSVTVSIRLTPLPSQRERRHEVLEAVHRHLRRATTQRAIADAIEEILLEIENVQVVRAEVGTVYYTS